MSIIELLANTLLLLVFLKSSFLERNVDNIVIVLTGIFGIILTAIAVKLMVEGLLNLNKYFVVECSWLGNDVILPVLCYVLAFRCFQIFCWVGKKIG